MKELLGGLLVGLFALQVPAAFATQDKEVEDHAFLMAVVEQVGVKVNFGGRECDAKPGLYGNYSLDGSRLNLCHVGDRRERLDTMRHESWHVYQDLADCKLKDYTPIVSVFGGRGVTSQFTALAAKHYETAYVPTEAEASWAAHTFDALAIANLIIQKGEECGVKFKF